MKNNKPAKFTAIGFTVFVLMFGVLSIVPKQAQAFDIGQLIDPACLFACDNDRGGDRNYTYNNSNNINSNINSPGATINAGNTTQPTPVVAYNTTPVYNYDYNYYNQYPQNNNGPLQVSCYPMPLSASTGQNISWVASAYGGNNAYYYTWTGTDGLSGYGSSVSKTYYSIGYKNASVTVTSGGQTVSKNCDGTVNVYGNTYYNNPPVYYPPTPTYTQTYYPTTYPTYNYSTNYTYASNNNGLDVACFADPVTTRVNQPTTWRSEVVGGFAPYTYSWTGTNGLTGYDSSVIKYYEMAGEKSAVVTIRSADGKTATRACSTSLTVRGAAAVATPKPPVKQPVVEAPKPDTNNDQSAAALFSLKNVPWGWVAILVILVLFATVVYLIFNRPKI